MEDPAPVELLQIGGLAERVQLSLRTVRYYDQAGLLGPASRTDGGYRLYDNKSVERLLLIKKMKPLGFTLDEMRSLLTLRDELSDQGISQDRRRELRKTLQTWIVLAEEKLAALRAQMSVAEDFVANLHSNTDRSTHR